ncbi:hypothetical protein M2262_000270 [Pseudomonas sp. BIGb0408]|uniref:Uncharacterized protein n=1 Tax=Phytopseudomonas flavescens TaxID=29435 RepID=A0A7Y9XPK8_9GAMM|nr:MULTISPECIES: hypothetical protein [Pseudomonas]MCW2290220.1 hypothetical protein [Pseudomonas sp. BIGb0408]NYH75207.1 hypothetical protein [Pseudomonas flavescens]
MSYSLSPLFLMSTVISAYSQASIWLRMALFQSEPSGGASVQRITDHGFSRAWPSGSDALQFSCPEAFRALHKKNGSAAARSCRTLSYGLSMFFCARARPIMDDIRVIKEF